MKIDSKKIGQFIAKLRKESKMTQEDLSDKLFVERETVSKWERGINNPNTDTLLKLCEIFNITFNEMILGQKKTKENLNEINDVTAGVLRKNNVIMKYLIGCIVIILFLLLSFLTYYFINNYNSISVYYIHSDNDNFSIHDGIMVVSREKTFIHLGNIDNLKNSKIVTARLYYEKNGDKIILYERDDLSGSYISNYRDSDLKYNDLKYAISNMYIEIVFDNNDTSILKLELIKSFSNNKIFQKNNYTLKEEDINNLDDDIPDYIKNNFKYNKEEAVYLYEEKRDNKKIKHEYYYNFNLYIVYEIYDDYEENYIYSYPDITYSKSFKNGEDENEFVYSLENNKCIDGECDNKIVDYFNEEYLSRIQLDK